MLALKAAKNKWRFPTPKGSLNLEQLFHLTQTELNELYLTLESSLQKSKGLLGRRGNGTIKDQLELVRMVFDSKVEDVEKATELADNRALREKVLEALANKEVQELEGKSKAALKRLAKSLA